MDYQLTQTGEQTQNLLDKVPTIETNLNAEILRSTNKDEYLETAIANEQTRAEGAEAVLETAIGNEQTRAEAAEQSLAGDIEDNATAIGNEKTRAEGAEGTLQGNIEAEATARENADDALQDGIDGINGKIPNAASSSNQLADKAFVNSSIATNTADFKGTYNSLEQLEQVSANANDYGFVVSVDSAGNTVYNRYKYVEGTGWMFEYALNNSSFTAAQWAAIQSGITSLLVAKLAELPTVDQLTTQLNQIIASVTAEKTRAENAEDALSASIAANTTAIGAEKTRAEGAEAVLREDIADNALAIAAEKTRAEGAEGTLQTSINNEKTRAEGAELTLQQNINAEATLRDNADDTLQANIDAINAKIPSAASSSNQLADKAFVNSSISTNTAEFKGTYNSLAELQAVTGANANDYGFVIATDAAGNTVYNRYKYVEGAGWVFEYALNNSSFTSEQWAAINSGITALLVAKLSGLPDIDGLNAMFAAITSLIPSAATSSNKLVDYAQMVAALATKQNTLTFDEIPTAGSDNPVKSKGILAAINAAIAPLATQADLTTLAGRVSTNEADIAALRAIYNALQQSAPQIIQPSDTWPVANPSGTVIYRVIDRVNTPPEYYSDYMWNGTAFVLMATYNNAIDDVPTAGSHNLVESGGVANVLGEPEKDITYTSADYYGLIWGGSSVMSASSSFNGFMIPLRNTEYIINVTGSITSIMKFNTIPTIGTTGGTAISNRTFVGEEGYYILITLPTSTESITVLSKAYGISSRLETDKTLTVLNSPADAKIVGDKINELGIEYYNKIYTYDSDSSFGLAWGGSSVINGNNTLRSYLIELKDTIYILNGYRYSSIILFNHIPAYGDTDGTVVVPSDNYVGHSGNYLLVSFNTSDFFFQVVENGTGIFAPVKSLVNTLDKSIIEPQAQYKISIYEDVHKVSQDIQNEFGTKYCLTIAEQWYDSSKLDYYMNPMNSGYRIELTSTDRFVYYTFMVRTKLNLGTTSIAAYLYSTNESTVAGSQLTKSQSGYNNRIGDSIIGIYYDVLPYNSSDDTYVFKIKIELKPNQTYPYLRIVLSHTFNSSSISLDEYHGFEAFYYRYWKSSADDYDFDYSQNFIDLNWNYLTSEYNLFQYRKIVLLGTSIEAAGYFNPVAEKFALPKKENYISYAQSGGSVLWYGAEFSDVHLVKGFSCTLQEKIDAMLEKGYGTGTDEQGNTYYMYPGTQEKVDQSFLNASYDISILNNVSDTDLFIIGTYGINDREVEKEIKSENYLDQFTVDNQHEFDRRCIYGAYNYVLDKLFTQNPRANVIIIGQHCFEWPLQDRVNEIQKAVARKWHIPFIDWAYELGITSYTKDIYIPDGMHPGTEGVKLLGDYLYKWLNRHSPNGRK